jgi:hypothetical protein
MMVRNASGESCPLSYILKIEVGKRWIPFFDMPEPAECFPLLRSEVCSWEMLRGMPATEAGYLHQLLEIIKNVRIIHVVRPDGIRIRELQEAVYNYLNKDKRQK